MFTSRTFIIFLIPLAFLGLFIWLAASVDVDRGNVKVAGALVGAVDVDLSVTSSYLAENGGVRKLFVEMEGRNDSGGNVNLNPNEFKLVLAGNDDLAGRHIIYNPLRYTSTCEQAPASVSSVPPGAVRSITLVFWGENLPRGDEWRDYHLSLEYYDMTSQLIVSKLINPTED